LHVPSRPHFSAIHALEEPFSWAAGYRLRVLVDAPELITKPSRVGRRPVAGDGSPPSVATEIDLIPMPVSLKPSSRAGAIERFSEARKLIFNERVEGVQDECTNGSGSALVGAL